MDGGKQLNLEKDSKLGRLRERVVELECSLARSGTPVLVHWVIVRQSVHSLGYSLAHSMVRVSARRFEFAGD